MSSKFFTWTKGDRKVAAEALRSGDYIPIPVECISIRGLEIGKTPKIDNTSQRSSDSGTKCSPTAMALHDATVESATSLMAVVNDLLNSPHISAHLAQNSSNLQLPYGRPRSRTAPTTPQFEAPTPEPAELEGSYPSIVSTQDRSRQLHSSTPTNLWSRTAERVHARTSTTRCAALNTRPSIECTRVQQYDAVSMARSESEVSSKAASITTPSSQSSKTSSLRNHKDREAATSHSSQQDDVEAVLLSQIHSMRSVHDAHIRSLKHAHDNEIASHNSYISFLEARQTHNLTKSPNTAISLQPPRCEISGQHSPAVYDSDQVTSATEQTTVEVEQLRRKLSTARKEQAESVGFRQQRDELQRTLDQRDKRVVELKSVVRKLREDNETLRNKIEDLEGRLSDANAQKLDVLEGFHVACNTLEALSVQKSKNELSRCLTKTIPSLASSSGRGSFDQQRPQPAHRIRAWEQDPLVAQVKVLQATIKEKDVKIKELQGQMHDNSLQCEEMNDLQETLTTTKLDLAQSQQDRDDYRTLLQTELRRQARQAGKFPASPSVAAEASQQVQDILLTTKKALRASSGSVTDELKSIPGTLEKELESCLGEIIMYKLDVKGYKKDIRRMKAELDKLKTVSISRPFTPPSSTISRTTSSEHDRGGLGIIMPRAPVTPPRTIVQATVDALLSTTPEATQLTSPAHRPRTPLGKHKKLPKPPTASSTSPPITSSCTPTVLNISRAETMRSMSDSIIASYTERATPELDTACTAAPFDVGGGSGFYSTHARSPMLGEVRA